MMDKCMMTNTNAKLICHKETVDALKASYGSNYEAYKDRIILMSMPDFQSKTTTVNDIEIKATKLPSWSFHPNGVLVFHIKLGNIKLFHLMGVKLSEDKYDTEGFIDDDTDVLLTTSKYVEGSTSIMENKLAYKIAYVHHIFEYSTNANSYMNICQSLRDKGFEAYVLNEALEQHEVFKFNEQLYIDEEIVTKSNEISADNINTEQVCIYPNPAHNELFLKLAPWINPEGNLNIFDLTGRKVCDFQVKSTGNIRLNLSDLPKGIYVLKIELSGMKPVNRKVIVE